MGSVLPFFVGSVCLMSSVVSAEKSLSVLSEGESGRPPGEMMYTYLSTQAHGRLALRRTELEKVTDAEDIAAYQQRMRDFFERQLGGFPERTPLNAQVVGTLEGEGFRVEKIVYESRPKFYVTALLYVPSTPPPYPGVLVPCGHAHSGKAAYQEVCMLLALNGIAALCYDPIEQGERMQVLKPDGEEAYWGTRAHTMMGVGSILVGVNTASYRIWDGIRGLDYLASRPEVDAERLGCTGNSGGGTLTSYIMALDERVKCAAPSCFLTSYDRLIDTIGPDDAEQQIFGQIGFGMDESDYVLMRAPKPTLMCTATHDFFDITGSWQSFREAKRLYTRLGFSERVDIAEADEKHGFTILLRTAAVRWLRRWLMGIDDAITEPELTLFEEQDLWCMPNGKVYRLPDARTSYDINGDLDDVFAEQRAAFWKEAPRHEALARVRKIAGVRSLGELPEPDIETLGLVEHDGYSVEKLVIRPERRIDLPALLFKPAKATADPYLYLHGTGKHIHAGADGAIAKLVNEGHTVLAVDLRGIGETAGAKRGTSWGKHFGQDWREYYLAYLLGRSYVGMRAEDTLVCARYLAGMFGERGQVHLAAIGEAVPPALHAAALEPELFASTRFEEGLASWSSIVRARETHNQLINTVHGALRFYDLPDLRAMVADASAG